MKYLVILGMCVWVFFLSHVLPQAEGQWYFAVQASWSFVIILGIYEVEHSDLTDRIYKLNMAALALNGLAAIGYTSDSQFFYTHYEVILNAINISEALVLVHGAPWDGIISRLSELWG